MAARQFGVFTLDQALGSAQWSRAALNHAVRSGRLRRVRDAVFAEPLAATGVTWADRRAEHLVCAAAAVLALPGTLASHASGALMLDAPVLWVPDVPCVTAPAGYSGSVSGIHVHRAELRPVDRCFAGDLPLMGAERIALDTARERGVEAGLVIADALLRRDLTDRPRLEDCLSWCKGWPGSRAARDVVDLADPRAESALESRSRWRLVTSGLPEIWPQAEIWVDGEFVGRVDFYVPEFGVIGEADGWDKYELDREKAKRENWQRECYERAGAGVVRWDAADLKHFDVVLMRIRQSARDIAGRVRRWEARPTVWRDGRYERATKSEAAAPTPRFVHARRAS